MAEIVPNVKTGKRRTKGSLMKRILVTLKTKHSIVFVSHNSKRQKRELKNQGEAVIVETEKIEVLEREGPPSL